MRKILISISLLLLSVTGCSVYKIDIQQGNTLEAEKVAQLKIGMNKQQVQFLLGTPMLQDPFHPARWDYIYSFTPGGEEMRKHHLTLYFDKDVLVNMDKSRVIPEYMDNKAKQQKSE